MRRHFLTKDVPMNLVPAAGFPLSTPGLAAVFEMNRRNADAVVRATYVVLDGLNEMAKRRGELLAAAVNDHVNAALAAFTQASFEEKASKQICALQAVYNSGVASLREQSGIAARANGAAGDILSTRVSEALEEVGMLFAQPGAPNAASDLTPAPDAEPGVDVEAAVVVEPAVAEAAAADEAAFVEVVPVVSPAPKPRPRKPAPPTRPARRKPLS
jgi:hypothetical protein